MKLRLEHLVIVLTGLVCLLIVEVFLLRSALVNEVAARQKMDQVFSHGQAVNTAKLLTVINDYAELTGRFGKVEREQQTTRLVFQEIGLIPVQVHVGKAKRSNNKAGGNPK